MDLFNAEVAMAQRIKALVRFKHVGPAPSLAEAANGLGVLVDELDAAYGVTPVDPAAGLYSVLVNDAAAARVEAALNAREKDPAEGVYGNPQVEPGGGRL
jgi:hypothetical protein